MELCGFGLWFGYCGLLVFWVIWFGVLGCDSYYSELAVVFGGIWCYGSALTCICCCV